MRLFFPLSTVSWDGTLETILVQVLKSLERCVANDSRTQQMRSASDAAAIGDLMHDLLSTLGRTTLSAPTVHLVESVAASFGDKTNQD